MDREDIKQTILQVIEVQLESQLRAIRQMQGRSEFEPSPPPRRGRRRQSMVDLSIKILTDEGKPLHVNDLVRMLQQRFGRIVDRDSLSSALAKKARNRILLGQIAPATFTLLDSAEDKDAKT